VKRLQRGPGGGWELQPDNPAYPALRPAPEDEVEVWGVVTYAIHKL
jgi:phage repressor protein C with HTH and peptisase S24 domain